MSSTLQQLKKILYGDFDPSYYDDIVQAISNKLTDLGLIKSTSLIKGLQALTQNNSLQDLFNKLDISVNKIEPNRLKRYKNYERLYQKVPELYQAVGIYTDNIISPDATTKKTFLILSNSEGLPLNLAQSKATRTLIKQIIDQTKLESIAETVVKTTLIYGDCFVEIIDANQLGQKWKVLQEAVFDFTTGKLIEPTQQTKPLTEDKERDGASLSRIGVKVHNPKHIVALYIGEELIGCVYIKGVGNTMQHQGDKQYSSMFQQKLIDYLSAHIPDIKKVVEDHPGYKDDIANIVKSIETEKVSFRFIPATHIVHFKNPSTVNDPYGESLFTPVEDIAKYVIASEIALLIYRLVRAPEKRIFKVNIQEDKVEVGEILEQVIRETKQKEYAVSQAGDVDALISEITMFDDLYIPVYDTGPSFEVDVLPGSDLNTKIDDLNYYKDKMIAGLGIPPIYLRPQDQQADNKSTLAQENARFARTIIRFQKQFAKGFTELISKVVAIVEPDKLAFVSEFSISFPPPVALMAERESEVINNISSLVENLEKLGIPKQLIVTRYLPQFDWVEIADETAVTAKIDNMVSKSQENEE